MREEQNPGDPPPSTRAPRGADDLSKGLRRVMADLMRSDALGRGDVDEALVHLTEVSAQVLRVGRASVWRFRAGRNELVCADLYEVDGDKHTSGAVIRAREKTPRYFAALFEERSIAASDARSDPRTSEFLADYLLPLGIASILDAPVFLQGQLVGVVCHEHLGQPRTWAPWEELVAGTFADFVGIVLGAAERNAQGAELERYKNELEVRVKERTKRLEESEASVRRLFNASPVGLVLTRADDSALVAINHRASELLGVSAGVEAGMQIDFWCTPGDRQRLLSLVDANGNVEDFETQLRRMDGSLFWADVSAQTMPFEGHAAMLYGIHDVTRQKEVEEQLRELATTDSLTGTLNRRHFFEIAEEELARATRYGGSTALLMLDADHFKNVNDRFGHLVGDSVLVTIGRTIREQLRRFDMVGRYGGEEFVMLLPETNIQAAAVTADRIRAAIERAPIEVQDRPLTTTVSIGVVERRVGEPLAELIRRSDEALYEAKANGRNRVLAR